MVNHRARPVLLATAAALTLMGPALASVGRAQSQALAPGSIQSVDLQLLGATSLPSAGLDGQVKPRGQNGDVAVLNNTAFVAGGALFHGARSSPGRICTDWGGVKVVNLSAPSVPTLQTTIPIKDTTGVGAPWPATNPRRGQKFDNVSVSASSVDAISHPVARKDVLAVAVQRCEPSFFRGGRIEFWDVTDRANPVQLSTFAPTSSASGIYEDVRMFTRAGKVFAVATSPFSQVQGGTGASADVRLIDITDVANPQQTAAFPPASPGLSSANECRAFIGGRSAAPTSDGSRVIASFYDGGPAGAVFNIDQANFGAASPPSFKYPPDPKVEGNAADVQPFTGPGDELMTVVSEEDYDPAVTQLSITAPATARITSRACEILVGTKLYRAAGQQVSGGMVYVGRGCPASPLAGSTNATPDDYLADPAGRIVLVESGGSGFDGCSAGEKTKRAAAAGATAILFVGEDPGLNTVIPGPSGGLLPIPVLSVRPSVYASVQKVVNPLPAGDPFSTSTTSPGTWERTTTTNVTVSPFPAGTRTDRLRFKSVADANDRVARGQTRAANRFAVTPGQAYEAGAFVQVESITGGAFRTAVVWYDSAGNPLPIGESEITSSTAVTARTRSEKTVVAPPGAATGAVKFEWTGGAGAAGTAYADAFELVPAGLTAQLKDDPGQWGAQRIINFAGSAPAEIASYRSPNSLVWPPPNDGIFAPQMARFFSNEIAVSAWMTDGVRVLDMSNPGSPREVGRYVPPDVADPSGNAGSGGSGTSAAPRGQSWPNRALITSVGIIPTGSSTGILAVSDINAGLYVLGFTVNRVPEPVPPAPSEPTVPSGPSPTSATAAASGQASTSGSPSRAGSPAASRRSAARGRGLPATGFDGTRLMVLGLGLLALGGAATAMRKRRAQGQT